LSNSYPSVKKAEKYKIRPVYFWRPWYPPSTFSKLLYNFDKVFNEKYIEKLFNDLESEFTEYFDCDYLLFTPSGSAAIFLVSEIVLKQKDILLPSLVCDVVPYAIKQSGNSLNFLEINPATYNIDENDILKKISSKPGAILTVHQFGFPCQMDVITDIAEDYGGFRIT
jgi:dTDP-4-amino-4,6-dideoxygalactose transaminase